MMNLAKSYAENVTKDGLGMNMVNNTKNVKKSPKDEKQHTMTVRLDGDTFTAFDKVCDDLGYSKSFVVRELIKKYLSNKQQNLF